MSIVFTMILAPFITHESVTRLDIVAALIIVAGCVVTTITGSHTSVDFGIDDVTLLYYIFHIFLLLQYFIIF